MRSIPRLIGLLLATALLAVACSSDPAQTTVSATPPEPTEAPATQPEEDAAMDDAAMDDSADDAAMDDSAMDDSADDAAMDDSAMDDSAMDEPHNLAPAETFGLRAETLHQFNLGGQIPGLVRSDFRGRVITFEPGGATAEHPHTERPGMVYVLEGAVTEHRGDESRVFEAGESWTEAADATHWVENHTDEPAVIITTDIVDAMLEEIDLSRPDTGTTIDFDLTAPEEASGFSAEVLGVFDLEAQVPAAAGFGFRMRRATFEPGAQIPMHPHTGQPGIGYVLEGTFTESRPERTRDLVAGESWFEDASTNHWALNQTDEPVVVLLFEIIGR